MRALRVAAASALGILGVASALRLVGLPGTGPLAPEALVPPLLGVAGLCVLGLAHGRSASIAWLATVFIALMAAVTMIRVYAPLRDELPLAASGPEGQTLWPIAIVLRGAVLAAPMIAAAYASDPRRRLGPWVPAVAWGVCGALGVVLLAGLAQVIAGVAPGDTIGLPQVAWLAAIGLLAGLGVAGDLGPAVARVRRRAAGAPGAAGAVGAPIGPVAWLRMLADELLPGRETARTEAIERERGRLASDLHAEVLPGLRRALATAEAGGSPERLAADLRSAVDDVEDLLAVRRSIVLEELGLLAALEWLAERLEERTEIRVELEVEDPPGARGAAETPGTPGATGAAGAGDMQAGGGTAGAGAHGRPPRAVERAAFRVARLALDNVERHAPGASVQISVTATPARVRLVIKDDGPGLRVDRDPTLEGRRGLADMREEARTCGASLAVRAAPGGRGTAIDLDWPA